MIQSNAVAVELICQEIIDKYLKTAKRFREAWMQNQNNYEKTIFKYADDDFYFYRFAVERQEQNSETLLMEVVLKLLSEYNYQVLLPNEVNKAPFKFIIEINGKLFGYRFDDFYEEDNINDIIENTQIDMAFIIRMTKSGIQDKMIDQDNARFIEKGLKLKVITIEEFFYEYFDKHDFEVFLLTIERYIGDLQSIFGFQSIKFLSPMNLFMLKTFAEKQLRDWPYEKTKYQVINPEKVQKYLPIVDCPFNAVIQNKVSENYLSNKLYQAFIGKEDFAKSFITSEWLFNSLKGSTNYDYTSIVSGYLKSIEQLLSKITELNIDNGCLISLDNKKKKKDLEKANVKICSYFDGKPYIEYTSKQKQYADSSIGTFEYFLKYNPEIFIDKTIAEKISKMVGCFRTECRNGFFHTHTLDNWEVVEKTRENTIYLYYVLLGSCSLAIKKKDELGIVSNDVFDDICKKIREFGRNVSPDFIFEFDDKSQKKMFFDFINNTKEYSSEGIEHYESLLFYEVDDFHISTHEKFDYKIKEERKFNLTRDTLPTKIICVDNQGKLYEI